MNLGQRAVQLNELERDEGVHAVLPLTTTPFHLNLVLGLDVTRRRSTHDRGELSLHASVKENVLATHDRLDSAQRLCVVLTESSQTSSKSTCAERASVKASIITRGGTRYRTLISISPHETRFEGELNIQKYNKSKKRYNNFTSCKRAWNRYSNTMLFKRHKRSWRL